MDKISIVIPVHNGEKFLKRISKCVLSQTYKDIELIFVENFSKDNSLAVLNEIASKDKRVIVLESKTPGTSFARKKGVENATGKYTIFMDQDDKYVSSRAVYGMYNSIVESSAQICQFSYYKDYGYGIKSKKSFVDKRVDIDINELRKSEIRGLLGDTNSILSGGLWNKIFLTDVLKDAIKYVNYSLYFSEDVFLNICCVTSEHLKKVSVYPQAYYAWNNHVGFSSSAGAGNALIKDYEQSKPVINDFLKEFGSEMEVLKYFHCESIYFMKEYLINIIRTNDKESALKEINKVFEYRFIINAKNFVNSMDDSEKWDELIFLAKNNSAEEFYDRFKTK